MTTYKYFKTKNSPLFPKSLHGNSYRLIMVEGSILLDLAHLPVLCLIQVLTLVVCTWSAVDSGHAGRDERQLEVSVFACAGVVLDMNGNESIGANAVVVGGFEHPGSRSTVQSGPVCVWASWGPLLFFLACRFSPLWIRGKWVRRWVLCAVMTFSAASFFIMFSQTLNISYMRWAAVV